MSLRETIEQQLFAHFGFALNVHSLAQVLGRSPGWVYKAPPTRLPQEMPRAPGCGRQWTVAAVAIWLVGEGAPETAPDVISSRGKSKEKEGRRLGRPTAEETLAARKAGVSVSVFRKRQAAKGGVA